MLLKMAQSIKEAATYIEQGHMRVGPGVPAHILTKPNTQLMLNSFLGLVAA